MIITSKFASDASDAFDASGSSFYKGPVKEGFYEGGWKHGKMHGRGVLRLSGPGHVTYYAKWENGVMCEDEVFKTSSLPTILTLSK